VLIQIGANITIYYCSLVQTIVTDIVAKWRILLILTSVHTYLK